MQKLFTVARKRGEDGRRKMKDEELFMGEWVQSKSHIYKYAQ